PCRVCRAASILTGLSSRPSFLCFLRLWQSLLYRALIGSLLGLGHEAPSVRLSPSLPPLESWFLPLDPRLAPSNSLIHSLHALVRAFCLFGGFHATHLVFRSFSICRYWRFSRDFWKRSRHSSLFRASPGGDNFGCS